MWVSYHVRFSVISMQCVQSLTLWGHSSFRHLNINNWSHTQNSIYNKTFNFHNWLMVISKQKQKQAQSLEKERWALRSCVYIHDRILYSFFFKSKDFTIICTDQITNKWTRAFTMHTRRPECKSIVQLYFIWKSWWSFLYRDVCTF